MNMRLSKDNIDDRFTPILEGKLGEYGEEMMTYVWWWDMVSDVRNGKCEYYFFAKRYRTGVTGGDILSLSITDGIRQVEMFGKSQVLRESFFLTCAPIIASRTLSMCLTHVPLPSMFNLWAKRLLDYLVPDSEEFGLKMNMTINDIMSKCAYPQCVYDKSGNWDDGDRVDDNVFGSIWGVQRRRDYIMVNGGRSYLTASPILNEDTNELEFVDYRIYNNADDEDVTTFMDNFRIPLSAVEYGMVDKLRRIRSILNKNLIDTFITNHHYLLKSYNDTLKK